METKTEQAGQGMQLMPAEERQAAPLATIPQQSMTPMDMIGMAVSRGASVEEIGKLMDLAERLDKKQAEKAFNAAKAAFNAEHIVITKDKENTQYKSMYTTIGNLVGTVRPFLGKHGLSADWKINQTNGIEVTCVLSHALGHSECVTLKVPVDTSGAKNPLQQIKSSITYARAATFEAVCGLASSDDSNLDDDGNGSGQVTQAERAELRQAAGDMRKNAGSKQAQPQGPSAELVARAEKAADGGLESFDKFWKGITGAERGLLRGHVDDLGRRVKVADQPKGQ